MSTLYKMMSRDIQIKRALMYDYAKFTVAWFRVCQCLLPPTLLHGQNLDHADENVDKVKLELWRKVSEMVQCVASGENLPKCSH